MDFVTFEIAKKLKEKGFREKCLGFYTSTNSSYYNNTNVCSDVSDLLECCNESEEYDDIDAHTISQVLKWLRNKRIDLVPMPLYPNNIKERYRVVIWFKNLIAETVIHDKRFETWEQAAIAGIEYVLNNLI